MLQRFLDPDTLASISGLDLVAKTVVNGFVAGLHRSPDFGFSQEFAEYRAYTPGDDLRHVDWNVFARTDRCFLKRYRGETNTQLLVLLDTSASMAYGSQAVHKLDYARFVAASLCYLANGQRDAAGLIVFDEDVVNYVAPSTRQGQLFRLLQRHRKGRAGDAHGLRQALHPLPELPPPPRHRGGALGFLRGSRGHRQYGGAPAASRQRSHPVSRARPSGDGAGIPPAGAAGGYGECGADPRSLPGIRAPRVPQQDRRARARAAGRRQGPRGSTIS